MWVVVLVLVLAAIAALDRILAPSVRWFFRRRMERAVAALNARLERPIEPFRLAQRQDMILRLAYDPKVTAAVAGFCKRWSAERRSALIDSAGLARS